MLLIALLALASPDGKKSAMDDWTAATIVAIGSSSQDNAGSNYLVVQTADLDGDGVADQSYLKISCDGGTLTSAALQDVGREAGSGMASGKRMHKPYWISHEWAAPTATASALKAGYDLRLMKRARTVGGDAGWTPVELRSSDGLCAATSAAAMAIVKSKSNITNN